MAITTSTTTTDISRDDAPGIGDWLVGDYYQETARLSVDQVADRVQQDLYAVRGDHLLPANAEFEVVADTDGTVPVLRVTITGLVGPDGPTVDGVDDGDHAQVFDSIRRVYGDGGVLREVMCRASDLADHYNRVDLVRPERCRFIQLITAVRPDGAPAVVLAGMMHDAISPGPAPGRAPTSATAPVSGPTVEPAPPTGRPDPDA